MTSRAGAGRAFFYGVVPLLASLAVLSPLAGTPSRLPLETNDEPAHTFLEGSLVRARLAQGEILKIDLFANFGTPVLGEPVICPFAPHALTYAFLRPAYAMVVNEGLLAAGTILLLTVFFASYLSLPVASLCALLGFTDASFFYFFYNHPHQGALFYFTGALLAIRGALKSPGPPTLALVYLSLLAFLLGVGVNGVLLGVPFLVAYAAFTGRSSGRAAWLVALAAVAAAVAVHAHYAEFFRLAARSARARLVLVPIIVPPPERVWAGLVATSLVELDSSVAVFLSWTVVGLVAIGLVTLVVRRRGEEVWLAWCLGLAPLVFVLASMVAPRLVAAIPGLRATNPVRVLWFSNMFLMLAAGFGVETLRERLRGPVPRTLFWTGLLLALLPRTSAFLVLTRLYVTSRVDFAFEPAELLQAMRPHTRMASDVDPIPLSRDMMAATGKVLGSAGRSIILDGRLRDGLDDRHEISMGGLGMTYSFLPAPPADLARLGIRWFVAEHSSEELIAQGWRPDISAGGLQLFENPIPATPLYVDGPSPRFLDMEADGNEVRATLPALRGEVVATFTHHPGWRGFLDGREIPVREGPEGFVHVTVDGARKLRLVYEPYSDVYLGRSMLMSLALGAFVCAAGGRRPKWVSELHQEFRRTHPAPLP